MKVTVKRGQLVFDLQLELDRTWKLLGSPPNEKLPAGAKFGKYSIVGGLGPVLSTNGGERFIGLKDFVAEEWVLKGEAILFYKGQDNRAGGTVWTRELTPEDQARIAGEVEAIRAEMEQIAIQIGLDVAGALDPTPVSDITSAGYQLSKGEVGGAIITLIGVLPFLGDSAKLMKVPFIAARLTKLKKRLQALQAVAKSTTGTAKVVIRKGATTTAEALMKKFDWSDLAPRQVIELLPPLRSPRQLAKHKGPIEPAKLVKELEDKGFKQVKKGKHSKQTQGENSDVFVRRYRDGNVEKIEAVRIDIKYPDPTASRNQTKSAAELQAADKHSRRIHNRMKGPENATTKQVAEEMNAGKYFKGDYTHYHHETFPASADNLHTYLNPFETGKFKSPPDLKKFDSAGQHVPAPPARPSGNPLTPRRYESYKKSK